MEVNATQKTKLILTSKTILDPEGCRHSFLGLSFKPHTDDIREARPFHNIDALLAEGAIIKTMILNPWRM